MLKQTAATIVCGITFALTAFFVPSQPVLADSIESTSAQTKENTSKPKSETRETVAGIGGVFFRAENPTELAQWYEDHLGVSPVPKSYDAQPWSQEAGATVFAPFSKDTEYFGKETQVWMINFRVHNLDAMVAQLREANIEVKVDPEDYPNGNFARLHDPEGNPIELWQPK